MRDALFAITVVLGVLALALCAAFAAIDDHPQNSQLRNAYWPYSVETSVKDL